MARFLLCNVRLKLKHKKAMQVIDIIFSKTHPNTYRLKITMIAMTENIYNPVEAAQSVFMTGWHTAG